MATTHEPHPDDDVIDLEPTQTVPMIGPALASPRTVAPPPPRPGWDATPAEPVEPARPAPVARAGATGASLVAELSDLRRRRVAAAAVFLAAAYAVLFAWNLFSYRGGQFALIWVLMGLRVAVAAGVASVLLSRMSLTTGQVHIAEYTLFGGLVLLLMVGQYNVNLLMMQQNDVPGLVAYVKNGVIQAMVLMVLYGMFVPNDAKTAAKVVFTMALAPMAALALMFDRADLPAVLSEFRSVEHAGSNALFLLIGAALAVYGAHVLNGLRTELHEAKRFGQYQLVRKLGAGGMGEVYLAEHQLLKRPCALKLIRSEGGQDPVQIARFEREVRSAAQLSHPNSIEIFDYGHTDDGTFYYVMEYLPGMSLGDLVERYGALPPGRLIYLMRQVCAGLARAHALGLIHRDLKPANVYVAVRGGESDVAKVLDFGLVKTTSDPNAPSLTKEHHVSGTPLYMSPEQATGKDVDTRSDLYALGAMCYFAATGRPPFLGDTAMAVMVAHARDAVDPPSKYAPGLPLDLEAVILKCLAKNPADRFPSVRALSAALAECADAGTWGPEQADLWWADVVQPVPLTGT